MKLLLTLAAVGTKCAKCSPRSCHLIHFTLNKLILTTFSPVNSILLNLFLYISNAQLYLKQMRIRMMYYDVTTAGYFQPFKIAPSKFLIFFFCFRGRLLQRCILLHTSTYNVFNLKLMTMHFTLWKSASLWSHSFYVSS